MRFDTRLARAEEALGVAGCACVARPIREVAPGEPLDSPCAVCGRQPFTIVVHPPAGGIDEP
jgi:hypothetical protein